MTCYRINGELNFLKSTSAALINTINTVITNAAAAGVNLPDDYYTKTVLADGTTLFSFSVRFTTTGPRDSIHDQLIAVISHLDLTKWSWVDIHRCYHDETPSRPCDTLVHREWGVMPPSP
jgi:hypothetical protein